MLSAYRHTVLRYVFLLVASGLVIVVVGHLIHQDCSLRQVSLTCR
jgi:hypothetical protein